MSHDPYPPRVPGPEGGAEDGGEDQEIDLAETAFLKHLPWSRIEEQPELQEQEDDGAGGADDRSEKRVEEPVAVVGEESERQDRHEPGDQGEAANDHVEPEHIRPPRTAARPLHGPCNRTRGEPAAEQSAEGESRPPTAVGEVSGSGHVTRHCFRFGPGFERMVRHEE